MYWLLNTYTYCNNESCCKLDHNFFNPTQDATPLMITFPKPVMQVLRSAAAGLNMKIGSPDSTEYE